MENSNHERKHQQSLEKILKNIKLMKSNIRESYKKTKCNSEREQEVLNINFENIINTLNEIHRESFNLDDMMIWESILTATDSNTMDELEKKTYDDFIFASQLARGKIQKIKDFNEKILEESNIQMNGDHQNRTVDTNTNIYSLKKDSEMDIDDLL